MPAPWPARRRIACPVARPSRPASRAAAGTVLYVLGSQNDSELREAWVAELDGAR